MPRSSLRSTWRLARALVRDWLLLLQEFGGPLLVLGAVTAGVALLFQRFYSSPTVPLGSLAFDEALYLVVTLITLGSAYLPPAQNHWLVVFYFLMPVVGILFAGQGILNFLTLLFNRQARGQAWRVAQASTLSGHKVVCGVGRVGSLVVQNLVASGADVVAIEQDLNRGTVELVNALGVVVLEGDARRHEILRLAGVPKADTVILCTQNDLANLEMALHCRELNPAIRVILRMFDPELARRVREVFGIEAAFSSSALAAPIFAGAALDLEVQQSFYVGDEVLSIGRLTVCAASRLAGQSIGAVEQALDLSIIAHERDGHKDLHPAAATTLLADDTVLALAVLPILHKLGSWNRRHRRRIGA